MMSRWPAALAWTALIAVSLLPVQIEAASLADIKERGWLRVCAHPDALTFSSQDRNQPGFQLEIADAIAKILGVKVVPESIVYTRSARRMDWDAIIGGGLPLTEQRTRAARAV